MKIKSPLLLLLFFSFNATIAQQWYPVPVVLGGGPDITSVAILGRDYVFAAGGLGQPNVQAMFRSNDYGLSWPTIFDGITANPWIKSVAFYDTLHGFAVGFNGTLKKSVAGYNQWSDITSPLASDFNEVIYIDSLNLFAVGGSLSNSSQVILKSTDGGGNWSVSLNQNGKWLKSVYFTSLLNGVAVGDSGAILKTTNGGSSWTPVTAPVIRDFNGITFVDANTGFIVGGKELIGSSRTILKTTDGGSNWSMIKDESGAWLTDISFVDQNTGYAVGDLALLFKTTDGGQNWNQQTVNGASGTEYFNAIKFYDPNFGVIGGKSSKVFVYTDALEPQVDSVRGYYRDSISYIGKARINANNTPTECRFEFSTNSNFSPLYYTYNQYFSGDTFATAEIFLNGLTPNTTYYYRFVAKSIVSTQYVDTLSFYTYGNNYIVETDPASVITLSSALLNGSVKNCIPNTYPYFIYSTNPDLSQGSTVPTLPVIITDTLLYSVTTALSFLSPNATYYYALGMQTPYGTITGDTLSFTTTDPDYAFQTLDATNIGEATATINGDVENLQEPVSLFFEYGPTSDFGDTVIAVPALVSDAAYHTISANLTSLTPYTSYYCRLRGTSNNSSYYGNPRSFFTTNSDHFIIQSLPATDVGLSSVVLNGSVDRFMVPANLTFGYAANGLTPQFVASSPSYIEDSLQHYLSATVTGLLPGTSYTFFIKGETSLSTFFSIPSNFTTNNPFSLIQTEAATNVNYNAARINGSASGFTDTAYISFEYGSTSDLGSQGDSVFITTVTDTLSHNFNADINGLSFGQIYYYRLKATIDGINFYGQTRQLYTGSPEIPNWDFQYWQQDTFDLLDEWNIAGDDFTKVSGNSGYALKLSGSTFAILGIMDDNEQNGGNGPGFFGGVPINSRPDSVSVYANVSFAPGDSGIMAVYLHKDITPVAMNIFKLYGNSSGTFTKFTFPISYSSGLTPDSVVFAFAPVNIDGNNSDPNDFIAIDDISFSPGQTQVYNGDCETWFSYPHNSLLNWIYNKHILINQTSVNDPPQINQVLFNSPDDYAAELKNIYVYNRWWSPVLSNREELGSHEEGGFPVNLRHQTLNGYYKWFPVNGDTMTINIELFADGQQIGTGQLLETDSVPEFTQFDIPINYYNNTQVPDFAFINISTQKPARGPSRSVIDKLSFDGFTTGIDDNVWISSIRENGLIIYPNPSKDRVILEIENKVEYGDYVQLFSLNGHIIKELQLSPNQNRIELYLSDLEPGFYLINVKAGNRISKGKIIVVK